MTAPRDVKVACFGIRRKGTDAIIGIVPAKVAGIPAKSEEYTENYEEVPLVLARALADVEAEVGEWKGAWNAAMDDLSRLRENNDELKAALAAATARCEGVASLLEGAQTATIHHRRGDLPMIECDMEFMLAQDSGSEFLLIPCDRAAAIDALAGKGAGS